MRRPWILLMTVAAVLVALVAAIGALIGPMNEERDLGGPDAVDVEGGDAQHPGRLSVALPPVAGPPACLRAQVPVSACPAVSWLPRGSGIAVGAGPAGARAARP